MENLVGRQIKGFKYGIGADSFIGEIGIIVNQSQDIVKVEFKDYFYCYPLDQIEQHLIPLEVFKLGQKVWDMSISEKAGEISEINIEKLQPIKVKFKDEFLGYTLDGRINEDYPKTLSSAPYTFQGFSQETIIERGTLVYYKDFEDTRWRFGFYDKFEDGKHYCFNNQNKEGVSHPWNYCQIENPLI